MPAQSGLVCPRLLALTEIVLKARGVDMAAFLGELDRFVADDSQKDVWSYLLGALDRGAADPHVTKLRRALATSSLSPLPCSRPWSTNSCRWCARALRAQARGWALRFPGHGSLWWLSV